MAIRICPLCMSKIPAGNVVAYTDTIVCHNCHKLLEVSRPSRLITTLIGLLAAFLVYRFTRGPEGMLGWVLPLVYAVLAWGIVSALLLMLTGDLRVRAEQPFAETPSMPAAGGHGRTH